MAWTAEQWREHRQNVKGVRPRFQGGPREAGKGDQPTQLPQSIYETGRELTKMMRMPQAEFEEKYLRKGE